MTHSTNIHMRLIPLKLLFAHFDISSLGVIDGGLSKNFGVGFAEAMPEQIIRRVRA